MTEEFPFAYRWHSAHHTGFTVVVLCPRGRRLYKENSTGEWIMSWSALMAYGEDAWPWHALQMAVGDVVESGGAVFERLAGEDIQ